MTPGSDVNRLLWVRALRHSVEFAGSSLWGNRFPGQLSELGTVYPKPSTRSARNCYLLRNSADRPQGMPIEHRTQEWTNATSAVVQRQPG